MLHFRRSAFPALRFGAVLLTLLAACEREKAAPPVDSARAGASANAPAGGAAPVSSGWDRDAGRYLLVPGLTPGEALVIDPERRGTLTAADSTPALALQGLDATLFGADGSHVAAKLEGNAPPITDNDCAPPWPVVRIGGEAPAPWTVGLVGGGATPVPLDSLAGLSAADSGALVAAAARVASSLPVQDEAYFRGLPFAVHALQRFTPAPGVEAFAAALVRRVSQEDSPLEERTFVVAEREGSAGAWHDAYHERSAGTEDEVESSEALVALTLAGARPSLVLVREVQDGVSYRLLERSGGQWKAVWTSALGKCR